MKTALAVAGSVVASALCTVAQSVSVDFNTPGQLANLFNIYQNSTPPATNAATGSPYFQSPIGGIGNGGAVAVLAPGTGITADSTAIYKNQSFDFSATGATLTISQLINVIPNTATGNRLLQLGFVNENSSGMNGNTGLAFMSLRLSTAAASGNVYTPAFQDKTAASGVNNTTLTPNVTLTAGDWYQLSGKFVNLGGGKFEVSGLLQDYGPTGQGSPATVFTYAPQSFSNADVTGDAAVWPAFRSFHADGANALDNFTAQAVPEPGTLALWCAGMLGLAFWRRNQPR